MLNKKDLASKEKTSHLKQKSDIEFFITIFIISLLTLSGFFMSHYNNNKFFTETRAAITLEISTKTINRTLVLIP